MGVLFRVASSLHEQRFDALFWRRFASCAINGGSAGWRPATASTCDGGDEIAPSTASEAWSRTIGGQQKKLPENNSCAVDRIPPEPDCRLDCGGEFAGLDCAELDSRSSDLPSTTACSHEIANTLYKLPRRRLLKPQRIEGCTRFSLGHAEPSQGTEHSLASKLQDFVRRSHEDPIYEN